MSNRRNSARERAYDLVDVIDAEGNFVGCLADVSMGGARLTRIADARAMRLGRIVLELPVWLGLAGRLELPGRFVWTRPSPEGLEAGFEFDALSVQKADELEVLVERLGRMLEERATRRA